MTQENIIPKWLPHPRAFIRAAKAFIPLYVGGCALFAFEFWRFFYLALLRCFTDTGGKLWFFLIPAGFLVISFMWFLLLVGCYSLTLKLLWKKPPKLFALPKLSSLIFRDFLVLTFSLAPTAALFGLPSFRLQFAEGYTVNQEIITEFYQVILLKFWWIWFAAAAFLYQWTELREDKQST